MTSPRAWLNIRTPLKTITTHAKSAAQSSATSQPLPPTRASEMPTNAAAEVIASDQWCSASTSSAVLPAVTPAAAMRRENKIFATTMPANRGSVNQCGPRCGVTISCTACSAIQPAATKITSVTPSAASGSALPWPYGWSASGGRAATRKPAQTKIDENTSSSDSAPSAISAYVWPRMPPANLSAASTRLSAMPRTTSRALSWARCCVAA